MVVRRRDVQGEGEVPRHGGDGRGTEHEDAGSGAAQGISLPWRVRSRQEDGRKTEKATLKREGARGHPNSGAGTIKFDGSKEDAIIEVKDARKAFSLNAAYMLDLFKTAARQGKQAVMIVEFPDITATIIITRKVR